MTALEIAREVVSNNFHNVSFTDEELENIIYEYTGFPQFTKQVDKGKDARTFEQQIIDGVSDHLNDIERFKSGPANIRGRLSSLSYDRFVDAFQSYHRRTQFVYDKSQNNIKDTLLNEICAGTISLEDLYKFLEESNENINTAHTSIPRTSTTLPTVHDQFQE